MRSSCESLENCEHRVDSGLQKIRHSSFPPSCNKPSLPWFDIRVFYVRVSNFTVDDTTPQSLLLNHIPLGHDTILEVNGARCQIYSDGASCVLRRDRVDKKSEEAIFVSTASIRSTGSVKFEVFYKEDLVLTGILEMSGSNGIIGESKNIERGWSLNCESMMNCGTGFLKARQSMSPEMLSPIVEVFVAGCYSGTPIILTKTLQLNHRKKHTRKGMLDAIPEYETTASPKDGSPRLDLQIPDYSHYYKPDGEEDFNHSYWGQTDYMEHEDGDLSFFNAGVRVGVGIGLGICVGLGVGVGLLARTYKATTGTFKRRLF
ncbi:hypothetical protein Leryth_011442 [Lithospermum erythrorhizon]|nr:hypothetical protein Leryth_011442 [Lithospermum erythrorhizon]